MKSQTMDLRSVPPTKASRSLRKAWQNMDLLLFCLPGIVVTFIYHYIPLAGVQLAFRKNSRRNIFGGEWIGMANFQRFFSSADAWQIIWNTFILSLYYMAVSMPVAMLLALLLNSFRHNKYRKVIQSVTYAPYFISAVVMAGMIILFTSPRVGVINTVIKSMGGEAVNFMGKAQYWRHIYVWSGVWQNMGWNSIIYFATLASVSPDYHEAAIVDGATKFQRLLHIDFPFLLPTATILLILNFGSFFDISFDKVYALQNDLNRSVSQIIPTYVYEMGLIHNDASFSSAVGLFNSAVNTVLLVTVNFIASRISGNNLF